ncbi:hypothetical protein [Streptomyces sp. CL12-4]|uniref:hypothetical protein n=1 Tax=Streptomyces sp. CL12-4 TaxID=2810306 RepID=UPI001EFA5BE7|nr:hypothetical protein [Streptomyces sp. CL12-4]MCG8970227.1 sel1 repeat family protein [Streptomyces sp. CL12-4]
MTVVRRFTEGSGGRPTPAVPAELLALMDKLAGPPDYWDRPDGDFGPLSALYDLDVEEREEANSLYRLGSKALGRNELSTAADWLGSAAAAGHPGALFRLALVALRSSEDWKDNAWFLIAEAARHGHGDAQRLLAASADRPTPTASAFLVEDTSFFEEVRLLLGVVLPLPQPVPPGASPALGRQPQTPKSCRVTDADSSTAVPGPVPPPVLPSRGSVQHPDNPPTRKRAHFKTPFHLVSRR